MSPPTAPSATDTPAQARAWLLRLASGTMDEAELQTFEQWLQSPGHRRAFEHERLLWRSLGPAPPRAATMPAQARRPRRRRHVLAGLAVAAVVLLTWLLPGADLMLRLRADHTAGHAVTSVTLPDGSLAVLDAGAAIALHYGDDFRRVELLRGRAWFDVAPGPAAPFRVTADAATVEDIATAFVVERDGAQVQTAVEQGRIRIATLPAGDWLPLSTGQAARWEHGRAYRLPDQAAERIATWRHRELWLDTVPVEQALAALDRYRPGHILVRGDLSQLPKISAALRTDRPEQALDTLAASGGLRVTRLPLGLAIVRPAR